MKTVVTVAGLKELDALLGQLAEGTAKNVLRRTGRYALEPFDEAWRRLAPEGHGDLKESGGIGSKLNKATRRIANKSRDSFVEVFAGPGPNPQAVATEFGTREHQIKQPKRNRVLEHPGQAPQPYLRPAWDETKGAVLERVKERSWEEVRKAVRRKAKKDAKAAAAASSD